MSSYVTYAEKKEENDGGQGGGGEGEPMNYIIKIYNNEKRWYGFHLFKIVDSTVSSVDCNSSLNRCFEYFLNH